MTEIHKQCEWLGWFDRFDTDESICRAAYLPVVPVLNLEHLSIVEACKKLDQAWEKVFVPGPQHVKLLHELLDQARGFARSNYPTLNDYNRQRCSYIQSMSAPQTVRCLTGLAGVSKSSMVQAFERICQVQPTPEFRTDGQRLMIYPVRSEKINGQTAVLEILKGMGNPFALLGQTVKGKDALMAHVRDWFMATTTSTLLADEMQFFTQSSSASTKTAQLIMTLANLGAPLVYVANYSLIRKLMLRPQEETNRFFVEEPLMLHPPAANDLCWIDAIREYLAVSPGTFMIDAVQHAQELHRYTAGLYRSLRILLRQAYREARVQGKHVVTLEEVKLAYCSRAYSIYRKDVEDLAALAVSSLMAEKRPDLVCPFTEVSTLGGARTAKPAASQQSQRLLPSFDPSSALIESAISAGAKATLRDLRHAADQPPGERTTASVTRMPKRPPVTAQSLLQGAQVLRDVSKHPHPSTEQPRVHLESGDGKPS
ncbi:hypothetical protein [Aquitalea sp.]|uniref:hypothetical protein n=1 Tax=Aquitalea sp. TaxID=1872623 RepID=UPI002582E765|nr:hypothetical protein [Aquitalea sp.]